MGTKLRKPPKDGPKVLLYDIETAPMIGYLWSIWEQTIGLNQIVKDWHLLSYSAKWLGDSQIMYADQRRSKDIEDDKKLLQDLRTLLDQADIVITQNGVKFDNKKVNARLINHGLQPPSSYKNIDTYRVARSKFGFTSNRLEYLAKYLGVKHKKLTKRKFSGFELWKACLAGDAAAWKEMERYNKRDVVVLEEVYKKLIPWDNKINFGLYYQQPHTRCQCGSTSFTRNGFKYTTVGKYQRYKCTECGSEAKDATNLIDKASRSKLLRSS